MEEIKVKAIVLKSLDYKEKDKLLDLFSLENGKLTVSLKGVRSPKAKLKFAGEPLNLSEYTLVNRNGKLTVTGATLISSFFSIATNYSAYTCVCVMQEILNKVLNDGEENAELFVLTLKCFKLMQENSEKALLVLVKFYLELLKILGFGIKFDSCLNCNKTFVKETYFSFDNGSFVCSNCKNFYDILVPFNDFQNLKILSEVAIVHCINCNLNNREQFLVSILNKNLEMRCFIKTKSFAQLDLK